MWKKILLDLLATSLLGNIFSGKVVIQAIAASLLGNIFSAKGVIQASEETIRAGQGFQCHFILWIILTNKNIIKTNLYLKSFIQEIIYLK